MKDITTTCLTLFLLIALAGGAVAQQVSVDDEFAPSFNNTVRSVAVDQRGKLLFGGDFTEVNGQTTRRLTRLWGHGGLDRDFSAVIPSGLVSAIAPTTDDRVLVGGSFTTVNGLPRSNLALLNDDGSTVATFAPQINGQVAAIALVDDSDSYFIAGSFTAVNGLNRSRAAHMLGANVNPNFVPANLTGTAFAIAQQRDGKVLLTGSVRRQGAPAAQGPVLRLNADGSIDPQFFFAANGANDEGYALVVLPDQRILLGGRFSSQAGQTRYLLRLNPDGTVDPNFVPPTLNGAVRSVAVQDDGRIVIVGDFTGVSLRNRVARLNADGSLDGSYAALFDPNDSVHGVALQRHQGAVFAGEFTSVSGQARTRAARVSYRGLLDTRFAAQVSGGAVDVVAGQPDGRVLLGGSFSNVAGQIKPYLARINSSGSLDSSFAAAPNNEVRAIAVLADRSVLIGGAFNAVNGSTRLRLAKLDAEGALDPNFNVAVNGGTLHTLTLQADGKILIGGSFTSIGATPRAGIARLHANGSLDVDFVPAPLSTFTRVRAIAVRTDDVFQTTPGQIYLGGETDGQNRLERLFSNGSLDSSFFRPENGEVWSLSTLGIGSTVFGLSFSAGCRFRSASGCFIDANGTVMSFLPTVGGDFFLGGAFTTISDDPASGIAQVAQPNQFAGPSELFGLSVAGDTATVNSLYQQDDGKLLFAGAFITVNGQTRERIARSGESPVEFFSATPATRIAGIKTQWDFSSREARFLPGGLDVQLERAPVLLMASQCCDAAAFTPVGGARAVRESLATHIWAKDFASAPSTRFFLRWRYSVRDGRGGTSLYESPILRVVPRSPVLSYSPAPSLAADTLIFPSGPAGPGLRQIGVTPSGTEGGTTRLENCAMTNVVGSAVFEVVRAVPANFTWERTAGLLELRCTRTAQLSTARLTCLPIPSDGTPLASVSFGLTCPATGGPQVPIFANGFEADPI